MESPKLKVLGDLPLPGLPAQDWVNQKVGLNWYVFEIILCSFWQIESDPPGFKEIGKPANFSGFPQTIDARYNKWWVADSAMLNWSHGWSVVWTITMMVKFFRRLWAPPLCLLGHLSLSCSIAENFLASICFLTFCSDAKCTWALGQQLPLGKVFTFHSISIWPQLQWIVIDVVNPFTVILILIHILWPAVCQSAEWPRPHRMDNYDVPEVVTITRYCNIQVWIHNVAITI